MMLFHNLHLGAEKIIKNFIQNDRFISWN